MKNLAFFILLLACVVLCGCQEEKEVINSLQFSNQYSSGIAGGWIRFASTLTDQDAGRYLWENSPETFSTSIYVVENIVSRCPQNPNFSYILIAEKGKEDNREVVKQILKDLQDAEKDIDNDGKIDDVDVAIIIKIGEQQKGNMEPAPEWISLAKSLPKKNIAVHLRGKVSTTWASLKKEK